MAKLFKGWFIMKTLIGFIVWKFENQIFANKMYWILKAFKITMFSLYTVSPKSSSMKSSFFSFYELIIIKSNFILLKHYYQNIKCLCCFYIFTHSILINYSKVTGLYFLNLPLTQISLDHHPRSGSSVMQCNAILFEQCF